MQNATAAQSVRSEGDAKNDFIGQTIAGRYRVVRQLGEGGQGHVFVAIQEALGREIALKVIRDELTSDPSNIERFHREAKTVSELQHPHIVSIYDFGVHEGTLFMAMEKLKGQSLRERLDRGAPIPLATSVSIVRDICSALAAAHELGVIHRDLKPDNVMLCEGAGRPDFAKVLDFGIAKRVDTEKFKQVTMQGMIVGTPGYLAPEVATGQHSDDKVDLYALGVIWYEMLLGRSMFTALTPVALVMKHVIEVPARLIALGVDVNPDIEQLVFDLLAKDPTSRPQSAEAVVARLESLGFTTATMPIPGTAPFASAGAVVTSSPAVAPAATPASSGSGLKHLVLGVGLLAVLGGGGFGISRLVGSLASKAKGAPAVAAPLVAAPPVAVPPIAAPPVAAPPVAAPPVAAPPIAAPLGPAAPTAEPAGVPSASTPVVDAASTRMVVTARAPKGVEWRLESGTLVGKGGGTLIVSLPKGTARVVAVHEDRLFSVTMPVTEGKALDYHALPTGKIVPKQVDGVKIFIGRELVMGNAPVSVVAGKYNVRVTKGTKILSKKNIDVKRGHSVVIDAAQP